MRPGPIAPWPLRRPLLGSTRLSTLKADLNGAYPTPCTTQVRSSDGPKLLRPPAALLNKVEKVCELLQGHVGEPSELLRSPPIHSPCRLWVACQHPAKLLG
eukprot:12850607-Alexandrium_andersonii.AAC.1